MNKDQLLHWKIPEFIGTKGDFKNMKTMLHDERRIMTQQVHQLKSEVANSKSEAWDSQYELAGVKDRLEDIENKRQEAEKENAALAACHKAELEEMKQNQLKVGQEHRCLMLVHNQHQSERMRFLQTKCEEYKRSEQASEAERQGLELQNEEALRQMEVLIQEAKAHDKLQQDQLELINKHKEVNKELEMLLQAERTRLARK
ncbi:hypothetical protein BDL97_02G157200 [Sphagnum fallax]|nr:hypothetical protein BDL97_02G157200 [Sphagnum fallax]